MNYYRSKLEFKACPLCGRACAALWTMSNGTALVPPRCSQCVRFAAEAK